MYKGILRQVDIHVQFLHGLPGPRNISVGEPFSVFFHSVDKYQITVLHIMIVDLITDLIEKYLLIGYQHDKLFAFRTVIYYTELIFRFWQKRYGCDAPVVKPDGPKPRKDFLCYDVLVPILQGKRMNLLHALRISLTNYFLMTKFTVDWLPISIHHELTDLPDPWLIYNLFRNVFLSAPPSMRR